MQIDFSKNKDGSGAELVKSPIIEVQTVVTPAGDLIACPTTNVPAVRESLPVGARQSVLSEIILPRINLVHSVGILKDSFQPGSYVHAQQLTLYTPTTINAKTSTVEKAGSPPLVVTFLDLRPTRFFEKVPGGGRGLICDSLDEVARAGGTTDYKEFKLKEKDGMRRFDYAVDALLAIERPETVEDNDTVFVFEIDSKKYALCLCNFKGAAGYTELKATVQTHKLLGCLRKGLSTYSYALSSRLKPTPDGKSTYWASVLVANKPTTPALQEFVKSVLSAPIVGTPDVE